MSEKNINLKLLIWRQNGPNDKGKFAEYEINVSTDASFLEMLDQLNDSLERNNEDPVAFESDCREGICGACGVVINGKPHGPLAKTTTCQLHMRNFKDGDVIYVEPFRAEAFPIVKDLVVDRSALDKIMHAGGYVSVNTGAAPDANSIPISKDAATKAFDAAACIGCGACVAACKNASAMLFVSAKISQLGLLPQGQPERYLRVQKMVKVMDEQKFGNCSNTYACEAECPKGISVQNIARMNRDFIVAKASAPEV